MEVGLGGRLDATNVVPTPRPPRSRASRWTTPTGSGRGSWTSRARRPASRSRACRCSSGPADADVRAAIDEVARGAWRDHVRRRRRGGRGDRLSSAPRAVRRAPDRQCGDRGAARAGARGPRRRPRTRAARDALAGAARTHRAPRGAVRARRRPQPRWRRSARPYLGGAAATAPTAPRAARGTAARARVRRAGRQGVGPMHRHARAALSGGSRLRRAARAARAAAPRHAARALVGRRAGAELPSHARRARRFPEGSALRSSSSLDPSCWSARPARLVARSAPRSARRTLNAWARAARLAARNAMPSFDIVSKVAVERGRQRPATRPQKEIAQRFDFKDTETALEKTREADHHPLGQRGARQGGARGACRTSSSSARCRLRFIDAGKPERTGKGGARIVVKIKEGIETEKAQPIACSNQRLRR